MSAPEKYKILHELGAGGMGKIYKGLLIGQSGFQRPIVIKRLRESTDPNHIRLFVEEARRYAVLDHENIGRIFDFETVGGQASIILEFIDGWSVVEYLERHNELGQLPDIDLSVFIASRVCRALQYVFERSSIVHRDISPSNIMFTREGAVKLIDFGIATRSGTSDGTLTGKPAYMAPEMVIELRADHRSDIFSLGIVLFEMLTLQRLFAGATTAEVLEQVIAGQCPAPRTYNPDIPDNVLDLLSRALQRDPGRRFASAAEMGALCEHILYDKGYGATNLTLKRKLGELFPQPQRPTVEPDGEPFPVLDPTLLPIDDGQPAELPATAPPRPPPRAERAGEITRVAEPVTGPSAGDERPPAERPRRIKPRVRN